MSTSRLEVTRALSMIHYANFILKYINALLKLLVKFSSHEESCSDGWEPKILDGISLETKF